MNIKDLQQQQDQLSNAIASIQAELREMGGDKYKDCWLDSSPSHNGAQRYTRLRWFIDVAAKKKGCRTLRGDEVGRATKAIALWSELAQLEAELTRVGVELREVEELAERLGLELPTTSTPRRQRRSDRTPAKPADVQAWQGYTGEGAPWVDVVITGYLGENRYAIRYSTGLPGEEDKYPAHCLTVE